MKKVLFALGFLALFLGAAPLSQAVTATAIPAPGLGVYRPPDPVQPSDPADPGDAGQSTGVSARDLGQFTPLPGPYGGAMSEIALSPLYPHDGTIFAANSFGGFYRSLDDGVTWSQMNNGLHGSLDVRAIAVSPAYFRDLTIFLATSDGVYRTVDGGSTWERKSQGIAITNARAIAVTPAYNGRAPEGPDTTARTVFVGTDGGGIYRSTDHGETWTEFNNGLRDRSISALAIPADYAVSPDHCVVFAGSGGASTFTGGSGGSGVFMRNTCGDDSTTGWQTISNQAPGQGPLSNVWVTGIETIPYYGLQGCPVTTGECWRSWQVFVATAYNGVWMASISAPGANVPEPPPWIWAQIDHRSGPWGRSLGQQGAREITGLGVSPDWAVGDPDPYFLEDPNIERRLIVSGRTGVFSADFAQFYIKHPISLTVTPTVAPHSGWAPDNGWSHFDPALGWIPNPERAPLNDDIRSLAMAPNFRYNRTVWATPWGDLPWKGIAPPEPGQQNLVGGIAWQQNASPERNVFSYVWSVAAPNGTSVLFAGTWGGGVWQSADGGRSWARVAFSSNYEYQGGSDRIPAADYNDVRALAVSPNWASDSTVFAGTFGRGVLKSSTPGNGPGTWERGGQPTDPFIRALALQPNYLDGVPTQESVFAGTRGGGVHRSIDGGANWEAINGGLQGDALSTRALAISPHFATDATIFLGSDGGIYKTTSATSYWLDVNWTGVGMNGPALLSADSVDSAEPGMLPPAPGDVDFRPSGLAQVLQQAASGGLSAKVLNIVMSIVLSPRYNDNAPAPGDDTTLFAAVWGSGIYRSTDKGATWTPLTRDNPDFGPDLRLVRSLAISPFYGTTGDHTLYAATMDNFVYRSRDNGQTWERFQGQIDTRDVASLTTVVNQTAPPGEFNEYTVYAGTAGRGVFAYTNRARPLSPQSYLPLLRRNASR